MTPDPDVGRGGQRPVGRASSRTTGSATTRSTPCSRPTRTRSGSTTPIGDERGRGRGIGTRMLWAWMLRTRHRLPRRDVVLRGSGPPQRGVPADAREGRLHPRASGSTSRSATAASTRSSAAPSTWRGCWAEALGAGMASTVAEILRLPTGPVDLTASRPERHARLRRRQGRRASARWSTLGPELADLQERLFAERTAGSTRRLLLVLQGMDTSGKGGVLRHTVGLVDPQGVQITSLQGADRGGARARLPVADPQGGARRRLRSASSTGRTTRTC